MHRRYVGSNLLELDNLSAQLKLPTEAWQEQVTLWGWRREGEKWGSDPHLVVGSAVNEITELRICNLQQSVQ